MKTLHKFGLLALGLSSVSLLQAHPGHGPMDLVAGFSHPLHGMDHLFAMLMVGIWGLQQGGRARWFLPVTFLSAMALGAGMGFTGMPVAGLEVWIALSVCMLGVLVAFAFQLRSLYAGLLIGLMGLLHGFAHGSEMPVSASLVSWFSGFLLGTALLHLLGFCLASFLSTRGRESMVRVSGALMALAGAGMLTF